MNDVVDYLLSKGKLNHFSHLSIVDEDTLYKYGFIHLLDIYSSIHDLNLENYLSTKKV